MILTRELNGCLTLCRACAYVDLQRTLTHWDRDKMDAISQTAFWSAFSWMKIVEFRLKFHGSLFLRVQMTIFQHWFSPYLNQGWLVYRRIYASLGLNELMTDSICGRNKGLSKQSGRRRFETPSRSLWRHRDMIKEAFCHPISVAPYIAGLIQFNDAIRNDHCRWNRLSMLCGPM